MALLRNNIWTLFLLFLLASTIMFAVVLWQRAAGIYQSYDERQSSLVVLINNALHSMLISQEMLLDLLGWQLLEQGNYRDNGQSAAILDAMLAVNSGIVAFGLADASGQLVVVSSNLRQAPASLPNLLNQEESRDSFRYALSTDKMVLGRTYFMPALQEWVIPVRKRIVNAQGQAVAVMTAGLRLGKASRFFNQQIHTGSYHDIMLLRERDYYLQYLSSDRMNLEMAYGYASLPDTVERVMQSTGRTVADIKSSDRPVRYRNTLNRRGAMMRGHALFNERYELWILSEIDEQFLVQQWLQTALYYLPILLTIQLIAFFLFRFIARAESERRHELIFQATHDRLTRLPNRNYLTEHSRDWFEDGRRFAMLFIDMDNFKGVNDGFGHECGDRVLRDIATRLRGVLADDDLVVRVGGDEFIVLTRQASDRDVLALAERVVGITDHDFTVDRFRFSLGVSVGIAVFPEHGNDLNSLMRAADIAMYEAKKHRNSVRLFEPALQQNYLRKILIEQRLRSALNSHELHLVYQPKVDVNGRLLGVEALVRWENPELGFIPPDQFIPVAEAAGLMPALGQYILQTALAEIQTLQHELGIRFPLSVNISVKQFFQTYFLQDLLAAVDQSGIGREQIMLEITENVFIEDMNLVVDLLRSLHQEGIRLSMDDFGTGYSSLSVLRRLPVDELKIDKSFVDTILHEDDARKMIQSVIAIGRNHGMSLVAEGVETAEQAVLLYELGCACFQGYHFAKPLRVADLRCFIRNQSERG